MAHQHDVASTPSPQSVDEPGYRTRDERSRRMRWTTEPTQEDQRDSHAMALTELLEEWEQFE